MDDLINELRSAGYGVRVGAQYMGSLPYADEIALPAGSCYGLQKMLDYALIMVIPGTLPLIQLKASYLL